MATGKQKKDPDLDKMLEISMENFGAASAELGAVLRTIAFLNESKGAELPPKDFLEGALTPEQDERAIAEEIQAFNLKIISKLVALRFARQVWAGHEKKKQS